MLDIQAARRIAVTYPPGAQHVPSWERKAYLTDTQQLAWLIRFDPEAAAEVMSACEAVPAQDMSQPQPSPASSPHSGPHHG